MTADSRPIEMSMSEAERIKRLERIVTVLRDGKEGDSELVEIIEALGKFSGGNGNGGTRNKVFWLVGAFAVTGLVGSYLAVQVIDQGKQLAALTEQVQQCVKVKP